MTFSDLSLVMKHPKGNPPQGEEVKSMYTWNLSSMQQPKVPSKNAISPACSKR